MASRARARARPAGGSPCARRASARAAWPLADRIGYGLCWATGIGLCLIAAAIVLYMLVKGIAYLRPSLFVQSPAPSLHQSQSGGFLRPDRRDADRDRDRDRDRGPARGRRSRPGCRSTAARRWLARAVESAIEMLAGVPSIVLAIFGLLDLLAGLPRLPLPARRERVGLRPVVPQRRGRDVGARAAAGRRRDARGARPGPRPHARGLLRARQDARDHDPPCAAARDPAGHRQRDRARHGPDHRRHRDRHDPARRDAHERTGRTACRCSGRCAEPARRSRATSTTTRPPARATPTRRPTRPRSCC